ncbi:MAG TPA: Crp/Fnr family transcriptional regulator [Rhizomicrobium sp.]|jgi:CRP-like cAMP-binding protein|nr:Crp/Fnr family transcriptional regulator [Rhizomicrobium sp.]
MTKHRNRLLAALSTDDLAALEPHLERVPLPRRFVLETPNKPIEKAYFMEAGVVSVVAVNGRDERIEVGLIGCEGMSGVTVVMGNHRSPNSTYMQIAGEGLRIDADVLRQMLQRHPGLRKLLLHFGQVFMTQTAQTAVANGRAKLGERLARWLLMAHDRMGNNDVPLTHEFLSVMLGVRRASVTVALDNFKKLGLIETRRGGVTMLDRKTIEKIAGSFYGVPEAEFRRLIG